MVTKFLEGPNLSIYVFPIDATKWNISFYYESLESSFSNYNYLVHNFWMLSAFALNNDMFCNLIFLIIYIFHHHDLGHICMQRKLNFKFQLKFFLLMHFCWRRQVFNVMPTPSPSQNVIQKKGREKNKQKLYHWVWP